MPCGALFAAGGTALVVGVHQLTATRIAASQQQELRHILQTLAPTDSHDNDLLQDTLAVFDRSLLGHDHPETLWRARQQGRITCVLLPVTAPDGYNGRIRLLVAVRADGTLAGVRVLSHHETPGLGDAIDSDKSSWIQTFTGRSLFAMSASDWQVRKDGGLIDQFTGATITPRAVVKAVHQALLYVRQHYDTLFAPTGVGGELHK